VFCDHEASAVAGSTWNAPYRIGIEPTGNSETSDAGWTFHSLLTRRISILASTHSLLAPPYCTATQQPSQPSSCFKRRTGEIQHLQLLCIHSLDPVLSNQLHTTLNLEPGLLCMLRSGPRYLIATVHSLRPSTHSDQLLSQNTPQQGLR
jgi:hypothetical protein